MTKLICIVCPNGCHLEAENNNGTITVVGNKCARGIKFATEELTCPKRSLTTTVNTCFDKLPVVSVRTAGELPKEKILEAMDVLRKIKLDKILKIGETVVEDILGTGIDVIITTDMFRVIK